MAAERTNVSNDLVWQITRTLPISHDFEFRLLEGGS